MLNYIRRYPRAAGAFLGALVALIARFVPSLPTDAVMEVITTGLALLAGGAAGAAVGHGASTGADTRDPDHSGAAPTINP
ncbi:hypothetical protein GCM10012275_19170 [Longimycelium tulufanense]|uniref:Uncharacterized protein n=1 Tax=Longimycelium tulufanense TaxID=907463 RepID=A0A8J3FTQ9_9PSEU|nr:hypothetical protein [Longimycelium tulufanense]GGM48328.1 hypothetical protein GCM10012275_19170 [Longimycelium tulufanense]